MANDDLKEALEEFALCEEVERDNREAARDDLRFTFLDEQWPEDVKKQREIDCRPCLTINKTRQFVKQVVNNGRRNKPSIKVQPCDSFADPATAEVISGLIRNIEATSNADVAYDTGFEFAVGGGFGYWRVAMEYAHDDSFDMDIRIGRISNPFSVYGDPYSTAADSSDWNIAFVIDAMAQDAFEAKHKGADKIDWKMGAYAELPVNWTAGDDKIIIAERWKRIEVPRKIVKLSDGRVVGADWVLSAVPDMPGVQIKDLLAMGNISVTGERETKSWKVTQDIMSGAEILETNEWPGKYIPLVPVYGEELNIEGRRHFRSLIRSGKDAQRMFNFWRTCSTELVALAPKSPFIGPVGAFNTDSDKWANANTQSYSHIEYDGQVAPQRQPFSGVPAGPLQEALNASDDMKAIFGMYDASLGARSNETSGVAINQRKQQGDMSTFDFVDNQARAIGHTGRIIIDLIPHCYNAERIIRVIGQDMKPKNVKIGPQQEQQDQQQDIEGAERIFDLAVGKYDLVVSTGPSFATQREESAYQMTEFIRAFPASAPVIGDLLAKSQDWPEAEEIAKRLQTLLPPQINGQNPQAQQMQGQIQQMAQKLAELGQQLQQAKADKALESRKLDIDAFGKETDRLKVMGGGMTPEMVQQMTAQTVVQALQSPDLLPLIQHHFAPMQGAPQMQGMQGMQAHEMPPNMPHDQQMNQPPPGGFFTPDDQPAQQPMPDQPMEAPPDIPQ